MNHATTPAGEKLIVLTEAEYRALTDDASDIALATPLALPIGARPC